MNKKNYMEILIILLFAVIIFTGITLADLMHQIDKLKLENDNLKNFNLSNISKFINESRKVIVRKKDCSTIPFKSHVAFDRDLSDFIIVIDLIEYDK